MFNMLILMLTSTSALAVTTDILLKVSILNAQFGLILLQGIVTENADTSTGKIYIPFHGLHANTAVKRRGPSRCIPAHQAPLRRAAGCTGQPRVRPQLLPGPARLPTRQCSDSGLPTAVRCNRLVCYLGRTEGAHAQGPPRKSLRHLELPGIEVFTLFLVDMLHRVSLGLPDPCLRGGAPALWKVLVGLSGETECL